MTSPERWPAILLHLDAEDWVRAADLADAIGVSESTVYREVHAMVEAGIPVRGVPGHGYKLQDEYLLSPLRLTVDEAAVLVLGSAQAAQRLEGRYRAAARAAHGRIEQLLPDEVELEAQSLEGVVPLARPHIFREAGSDSVLPQVAEAVKNDRTLTLTVDSRTVDIDPYGLLRKGSTWFVVGREHERHRVVQLGLNEIDALAVTDQRFERPSGYGSASAVPHIKRQQRIRLLFSAEAAPSVRIPQNIDVHSREHRPDGHLLLALQPTNHSDLIPWLLSWGRHVKVLEPRTLRERVAAQARAIADQYESAPSLLD